LLMPGVALARTIQTDVGPAANVADYVTNILKYGLPILGGLAFLMLIYAGYLYMTSQGNPETIGRAKDIIIGVIVGIVLIFMIRIIMIQILPK